MTDTIQFNVDELAKQTELLAKLPAGTMIEKSSYCWKIETPTRKGYKSCGVTLLDALEHALEGEAQRELNALNALAGAF